MPVVGLVEAAKLLGVSRSTVRRRIEKGELSATKEQTSHGVNWRITIPDEEEQSMAQERIGDAVDRTEEEAAAGESSVDTPEDETPEKEPPEDTTEGEDAEKEPPEEGLADAVDTTEDESVDSEPLDPGAICPICHQPLFEEDSNVVAAYGTVHAEPCSHQTYQRK